MGTFLLGILFVVNVVLLVLLVAIFRRTTGSSQTPEIMDLARQTALLHESLGQKFNDATVDMATRLESTKGDLRQGVTDRLTQGFNEIRTTVEAQLSGGRREQTQDLREARTELTTSLALTTSQLKIEFELSLIHI